MSQEDHIVEVRYTQVAGDANAYHVKQQLRRWLDIRTGELFDDPSCVGVPVGIYYKTTAVIGEWLNDMGSRVRIYAPQPSQEPDLKFDSGKPRWSLLMRGFAQSLAALVRVLTFGANKYAAHSWRTVPNGEERYRDALYRHLAAIEAGEKCDPESGESHYAHAAFNILALHELELQNDQAK